MFLVTVYLLRFDSSAPKENLLPDNTYVHTETDTHRHSLLFYIIYKFAQTTGLSSPPSRFWSTAQVSRLSWSGLGGTHWGEGCVELPTRVGYLEETALHIVTYASFCSQNGE
jgi:hypothetical protein